MGKQIEKLTALQVKAFNRPGGRLSDGGNLYLAVAKVGSSKAWEFTFKRDGRQRTKSVGPLHSVSMKQARAKAAEYRQLLLQGLDPIGIEQAAKRAQSVPTFGAMSKVFLDKKAAEWRAERVKRQAVMMFEQYCAPIVERRSQRCRYGRRAQGVEAVVGASACGRSATARIHREHPQRREGARLHSRRQGESCEVEGASRSAVAKAAGGQALRRPGLSTCARVHCRASAQALPR